MDWTDSATYLTQYATCAKGLGPNGDGVCQHWECLDIQQNGWPTGASKAFHPVSLFDIIDGLVY